MMYGSLRRRWLPMLTRLQGRILAKLIDKVNDETKLLIGIGTGIFTANLTCLIPLCVHVSSQTSIDLVRKMMISGCSMHRLVPLGLFLCQYIRHRRMFPETWRNEHEIHDHPLFKVIVLFGGFATVGIAIMIIAWSVNEWNDVVSQRIWNKF